MKKPLTIIAAVATNKAIGRNNDLLWHIPGDLKMFKHLTTGHKIIMGRKTFDSLPNGPLPNREHIIITKKTKPATLKCVYVNSIEAAIELCDTHKENFVIGGGAIYKLLLPYANKMYITKIFEEFDADTFFPDFKESDWKHNYGQMDTVEKTGLKYRFDTYYRL